MIGKLVPTDSALTSTTTSVVLSKPCRLRMLTTLRPPTTAPSDPNTLTDCTSRSASVARRAASFALARSNNSCGGLDRSSLMSKACVTASVSRSRAATAQALGSKPAPATRRILRSDRPRYWARNPSTSSPAVDDARIPSASAVYLSHRAANAPSHRLDVRGSRRALQRQSVVKQEYTA